MSLGARARNDYFSTRFLTQQQVLSLRNATPRLHKDRKTKKLLPETQKKKQSKYTDDNKRSEKIPDVSQPGLQSSLWILGNARK